MDRKPREIIFGEEVRQKIMQGVRVTYEAVATTLGSRGRNVSFERNWGTPKVIHDGVTVAKQIVLKDPFANQAAQLTIEAAKNTNNSAGDGTTTATILTYAIVKEGIKQVSSGVNPMVLRKGIDKGVNIAIDLLKSMATEVKKYDDMKQVATISAADESYGAIIADAITKVGEHGVVTVAEGKGNNVEVEYKEGMDFDRGFMSPFVVTDKEKLEVRVESADKDKAPYIVLYNDKLTNKELATIYTKISEFEQGGRFQLVIIANDFDEGAAGTLIVNKAQQNIPIWGVKAPEFGDHRTNMLNDMATITGGMVIGGDSGLTIDQFACDWNNGVPGKSNVVGRVDRIIIGQKNTVIAGGHGSKKDIEARIKGIKASLKTAKDVFQKDKIESRLAKLVGGVAVINVGAASEAELQERKERVYDAVNATQAAIEEGIVAGGGVSLLHASKAISVALEKLKDPTLKMGMEIVRDALKYPAHKLVSNSGHQNPGYVVEKIINDGDLNTGYNVDSEQFENMFESGIIDPVKVEVSALVNAASVAIMLLTTECMISVERDEPSRGGVNPYNIEGIGSFND